MSTLEKVTALEEGAQCTLVISGVPFCLPNGGVYLPGYHLPCSVFPNAQVNPWLIVFYRRLISGPKEWWI